jgi:hypothetical protein
MSEPSRPPQPEAPAGDGGVEELPQPSTPTFEPLRRGGRRIARLASGAEPVVDRVAGVVAAAGRRWQGRRGAREAELRRAGREPLPNLYDVHQEAQRATPREIGMRSIPIEEIRGTAVRGPDQRGRDFLPLPPFRSANWSGRWQRVLGATERLVVLPPIDVVKVGDGYWVLDGHNRVAAALYAGQIEIDASITELRLPGQPRAERPHGAGALMAGTRALRTAGAGRPLADELLVEDVDPGYARGRPGLESDVEPEPALDARAETTGDG